MASGSEAHILSIIESGEVLSSISAYLRPFSNLLICREEDRALAIQSMAKQFLPFLAKSLSLLEKRLSVVVTHESPEDLFRAYDFCLECCELVSHDPPHAVQLHRLGLIHCYRTWGWFTHAYNDSIRVLQQVTGSSESRSLRFLRDPGFGDQVNLSRVLLWVVASIVGSVAMLPDMDEQHYWTVCSLIIQIKPWLRSYLDANAQENFLKRLLSDMKKCALSIIKEAKRFDDKFVVSFCSSMLNHYFISSLPKCYFHKFSRQVLSLLFLSKEIKPSQPFEIVMSLLRTAPRELQVEPEANWLELVGLVSYCAHESQLPGGGWCPGVPKHLSEMAAVFSEAIPQTNVILRLYSAGLSITVFVVKFSENGQSLGLQALLGDHDIWKSLVSLLGMIDHYPDDQSTTSSDRKKTTQVRCKHNGGVEYTLPYLKALRFVCEPLASLINYERKNIVAEREFACYTGHLSVIQDMFLQFFYGLRFLQRRTPDKECSGRDFDKALRDVVMAAFIISMRTQRKVEITARLVEDVIASPWISPPDLKYLSASFHYIGVSFYNAKNLKKASMAFKLCIRLVWTCVRLLCQMYVNESNPSEEAAITYQIHRNFWILKLVGRIRDSFQMSSSLEQEIFLQWGNKKRLRCLRAKDKKISRSKTSSRLFGQETFLLQSTRFSRGSEGAILRSGLPDHRRTSPEKEDRYYMTRGVVDNIGKDCFDGNNGEDSNNKEESMWPKLFITLSSKEKEEDFMAMKGCKPSHRPKKRAKLIQRSLLLVSPGTWLADLCPDRYDVRVKKSSKKV